MIDLATFTATFRWGDFTRTYTIPTVTLFNTTLVSCETMKKTLAYLARFFLKVVPDQTTKELAGVRFGLAIQVSGFNQEYWIDMPLESGPNLPHTLSGLSDVLVREFGPRTEKVNRLDGF